MPQNSSKALSRRVWFGLIAVLISLSGWTLGCEDQGEVSRKHAVEHVEYLVPVTAQDVKEVRDGLPKGAPYLAPLWKDGADPTQDPQTAKQLLETARHKVQDLRVAKSTFFAVTTSDGTVVRNDQDQDLMAGKKIFPTFDGLEPALQGKYSETIGRLQEANGVKGKPDGQWVAASPITQDGKVVGLYVTGWAWSLYAKRLEYALASHIADTEKGKKPLYYVFVVVDDTAFGTGPSPLVNAEAIQKLEPLKKLSSGEFSTKLTITGRDFGLAVKATPELGKNVAIAVLRSET